MQSSTHTHTHTFGIESKEATLTKESQEIDKFLIYSNVWNRTCGECQRTNITNMFVVLFFF